MNSLDTHSLMLALAVISFVALSASIYVNIFLLRWRRSASSNDLSIVPSELLATLGNQTKALGRYKDQQAHDLRQLSNTLQKILRNIQREIGTGVSRSGELLEAFIGLQTALDSRDKEIQRLRTGYDTEIFRRFVTRFLRIDRTIAEELEEVGGGNQELHSVLSELHVLLQDALADCGLEQFTPSVGQNIRETEGIDQNYKSVPAAAPEQALTIAEVLSTGWRIPTPSGFDYLKKARVAVYVSATDGVEAV